MKHRSFEIGAILLFFVMCSPPIILGQNEPPKNCPIEIKKVKTNRGSEGNPASVRIAFTNVTGKAIAAAQLGVIFVDEFNNLSPAAYRFKVLKKVKPGKDLDGTWDYAFRGQSRADVFAMQVRFEDGAIWESGENYPCNLGVPGAIAKGGLEDGAPLRNVLRNMPILP